MQTKHPVIMIMNISSGQKRSIYPAYIHIHIFVFIFCFSPSRAIIVMQNITKMRVLKTSDFRQFGVCNSNFHVVIITKKIM